MNLLCTQCVNPGFLGIQPEMAWEVFVWLQTSTLRYFLVIEVSIPAQEGLGEPDPSFPIEFYSIPYRIPDEECLLS